MVWFNTLNFTILFYNFAARGPMQIKAGQSVDDFIREGKLQVSMHG